MIISWVIMLKLHRKHSTHCIMVCNMVHEVRAPDCPNQSGAASYCNLTYNKSDVLSINQSCTGI